MYGEIKVGEKTIEVKATGTTPVHYNQIFHADFFEQTQNMGENGTGLTIDVFMRLAFVMMKQAEGKDMSKVNEGQFYKWLDDFEPMDLPNAMPDIVDFYMGNTKGTAKAKK